MVILTVTLTAILLENQIGRRPSQLTSHVTVAWMMSVNVISLDYPTVTHA